MARVALLEVMRIIREEEPPKPSTRLGTTEELPSIAASRNVEPVQLRGLVRGELDWIVMKCLEKDRDRRYETAAGLARDLERHLHDEPVEAGPPSRTYRLRKLARKHRTALVTTTAFALVLVAATVGLTIGAIHLAHANARIRQANAQIEFRRREAVANLEKAEANFALARDAVDRFYVKVSEEHLLNEPHMERLRRELLEAAREFYQKFVDERKDDPAAWTDLGQAYHHLSVLSKYLGSLDEGIERARQAVAVFAKLARDHPEAPRYKSDLALSYYNLASLSGSAGRRAEAEETAQRAVAIREELARTWPEVAQYQNDLASSYINLGSGYWATGRSSLWEESAKRAVAILEGLPRSDFEDTQSQRNLAKAYENLGEYYLHNGRPAQAKEAHQRAVVILEGLTNRHPENVQLRYYLAGSYLALGRLCRWDAAEEAYTKARAILERLVHDHPEVTRYQRLLAQSHFALGMLYQSIQRPRQSEEALKRAVAIQEKSSRDHPEDPHLRRDLGYSIRSLGELYRDTGRLVAAEEALQRALAIEERLASDDPRNINFQNDVAGTYFALGMLHHVAGRHAEALANLDKAIARVDERSRDHFRLQRALLLARSGDHASALTAAEALAQSATIQPGPLFHDLACVAALAAEAVRDDPALEVGERAERAEQFSARSLDWLEQARRVGFFGDPARIAWMDKDPYLDPLRSREDFQAWRTGLLDQGFPTDPFAR